MNRCGPKDPGPGDLRTAAYESNPEHGRPKGRSTVKPYAWYWPRMGDGMILRGEPPETHRHARHREAASSMARKAASTAANASFACGCEHLSGWSLSASCR
eukprot:131291-Prymnesium_polylepis.2